MDKQQTQDGQSKGELTQDLSRHYGSLSESDPSGGHQKEKFNSSFHNYRFLVVSFGGMSVGLMLLLRYSISVSILNMVNQTAVYLEDNPNKTIEDFYNEGYKSTGEFAWDNEIQHMIMSWYMIAYSILQFPATKLALAIGSRRSVAISLGICALSTILVPPFAYLGWQYVVLLRLIGGLGGAPTISMMLNVIENWMPHHEISLGLTCAQLLTTLINTSNPFVAGYLSAIHWSYGFYIPGVATIVFCVLWLILITDHPEENFFVSLQEVNKIRAKSRNQCVKVEKSTDEIVKKSAEKNKKHDERLPTWLDIFKVPSFYAYCVVWSFYCAPYCEFSYMLPNYLRQFLKIDVEETGFYCTLIMSGTLISAVWPHPMLRFLQQKLKLSATSANRYTYFIICSVTGLTWFYVGTFHSSQLLMLFINRAVHVSNDVVVTSSLVSNFASANLSAVAFSMMNSVANLFVVFSSTFWGYFLDKTGQSETGWTYIYWTLASVQLVCLILFNTLCRAEPIQFGSKMVKAKSVV